MSVSEVLHKSWSYRDTTTDAFQTLGRPFGGKLEDVVDMFSGDLATHDLARRNNAKFEWDNRSS